MKIHAMNKNLYLPLYDEERDLYLLLYDENTSHE